jgi:hypothetical protein
MMARADDAVKQNRTDTVTLTNPPTGTVRWNVASNTWEHNTGTPAAPTWANLSSTFAINVTSATQWTTARTLDITGDATGTSAAFNGTGNVSFAVTLATVNANVGSFGSASVVPVITVNAKGLITAISTANLASMATQSSASINITGGSMTNVTHGAGNSWTGNVIAVAYGGTGVSTISGLVKGNGTSAMTAAVAGTDYQSPLVSGTNIKTLNGASVLGSGNIALLGRLTLSTTTSTSFTAAVDTHYVCTAGSAVTVTLPITPAEGATVGLTFPTTVTGHVVARNGQTIMSLAENLTIDAAYASIILQFAGSSWRIVT